MRNARPESRWSGTGRGEGAAATSAVAEPERRTPRRKAPDVTIQIKRTTKRHRPDDPDSIATEPISARPDRAGPGAPGDCTAVAGPTPSSSSLSSAEYYITCFRCINSFRDGSGRPSRVRAGAGPVRITEDWWRARDRIRFFRRRRRQRDMEGR